MEKYEISNKRDCLIFPIGKYDDSRWNRSNALKDAEMLRETFEKLNFHCQETYKKFVKNGLDTVFQKNT